MAGDQIVPGTGSRGGGGEQVYRSGEQVLPDCLFQWFSVSMRF